MGGLLGAFRLGGGDLLRREESPLHKQFTQELVLAGEHLLRIRRSG